MAEHETRLDDPSKIMICGYKASDLIKIAGLLKNSQSWRVHGQEIFMAMGPALGKLAMQDNKRLAERKTETVSDLARKVTERQTQRLRMLEMVLGWCLHEISLESEMIHTMMEGWRNETFGDRG